MTCVVRVSRISSAFDSNNSFPLLKHNFMRFASVSVVSCLQQLWAVLSKQLNFIKQCIWFAIPQNNPFDRDTNWLHANLLQRIKILKLASVTIAQHKVEFIISRPSIKYCDQLVVVGKGVWRRKHSVLNLSCGFVEVSQSVIQFTSLYHFRLLD